jgi:hypothetical protein
LTYLTKEEVLAAEFRFNFDINGDGTISEKRLPAVDYRILAGGGGGSKGAGGGAGGFEFNCGDEYSLYYRDHRDRLKSCRQYIVPTNQLIEVVIGSGGAPETNGGNSRFGDITVYGGGAGVWNATGINGGSGGAGNPGGSSLGTMKNGSYIKQGYPGGNNFLYCGGGGGGALSAGGDGQVGLSNGQVVWSNPGVGGRGFVDMYTSSTGGSVYRGYGGSGSHVMYYPGYGGGPFFFNGANASANTGSGGGGGGGAGRPGSGGSGFLVFRFNGILYNPKIQVSGGVNYLNYTADDGYVYYEFIESANITFNV